jgi:hypothetical protein
MKPVVKVSPVILHKGVSRARSGKQPTTKQGTSAQAAHAALAIATASGCYRIWCDSHHTYNGGQEYKKEELTLQA